MKLLFPLQPGDLVGFVHWDSNKITAGPYLVIAAEEPFEVSSGVAQYCTLLDGSRLYQKEIFYHNEHLSTRFETFARIE